jgi:hypothetical protein
MKSSVRSFILLGLAVNAGCATVQPGKAFDRLDASPGSVTVSQSAVGPQRVPIGFARPASVDTRDVRTIQGYSVSRNETAASGAGEIQPGVLGAGIGAFVGGTLGWLRVQMYCDNGSNCPAARSVLTGAAIGATLGLFVEWVFRSGPAPAKTVAN